MATGILFAATNDDTIATATNDDAIATATNDDAIATATNDDAIATADCLVTHSVPTSPHCIIR